jgi:hypothetical protein
LCIASIHSKTDCFCASESVCKKNRKEHHPIPRCNDPVNKRASCTSEDPLITTKSWFGGLFKKVIVFPSPPSLDYDLLNDIKNYLQVIRISSTELSNPRITRPNPWMDLSSESSIYSYLQYDASKDAYKGSIKSSIGKLDHAMRVAHNECKYWNSFKD